MPKKTPKQFSDQDLNQEHLIFRPMHTPLRRGTNLPNNRSWVAYSPMMITHSATRQVCQYTYLQSKKSNRNRHSVITTSWLKTPHPTPTSPMLSLLYPPLVGRTDVKRD